MMEEFGADYRQILTLSMPALARLANDSMAEIVARRPDRFPGFVASLGLDNVPAALGELRRAIEDLGAIGIQLFTNVGGRPLDHFKKLIGDTSLSGSKAAIACGLDFFGAEQAGGVRVGLPLRPRRRPENQVVTKL